MPQTSYKEPYNNNMIDRYNPSNIPSRFNSIQLNHSMPYIDNHPSSQSFYGLSSNHITQYPAIYGMQKNRRRNYRLHNGYTSSRQYCYDVVNGPCNVNSTFINTNNELKQAQYCNDIHNNYSSERKTSIHNVKEQGNKASKSSNNYKRCGNNIVVKVNEYVNNASMANGSQDTAITRQPSSVNENVNNIEETSINEVIEEDCENVNTESNYGEIINESIAMNAEGKPEEKIESSSKSSREKTPMCLVNDLARFNKIPFQYRLTSEHGLAHCKVFTVTLKLGDEEYTAEGHKIKKAQHLAAKEAIEKTKYKHPIPKSFRRNGKHGTARAHVMPTVELNALAMKLGQQTCYVLDNNVPHAGHPFSQIPCGIANQIFDQHDQPQCFSNSMETGFMTSLNPVNALPKNTLGSYKMTLYFDEKKFTGFGRTPQQAKHDAAARALPIIKAQANDKLLQEKTENQSSSHTKSPVSLVFEMALKRNLNVNFRVVSEEGPAHMKKFTTACAVGPYVVKAEGTGKRISKKKAAQKMLEELQKLPPIVNEEVSTSKQTKRKLRQTNNQSNGDNAAISSITSTEAKNHYRKRRTNAKSKEYKELMKINTTNILTKLKEWCEKHNEQEPTFETVTEKTENTRRGECIVEVNYKGTAVRGVGKNKGLAKYNAAKNLLNAIGIEYPELNDKQHPCDGENLSTQSPKECAVPSNTVETTCTNNISKISSNQSTDDHTKRGNDTEGVNTDPETINQIELNVSKKNNLYNNSSGSTKRDEPQLLNTAAQKCDNQIGKNDNVNHKSSNSFHMKDQLMYLANLLGFEITFSDYPKGNHSESLTIVMLSTNPPQICHGIGITSAESQENASRNALKILSEMGLNNVKGS